MPPRPTPHSPERPPTRDSSPRRPVPTRRERLSERPNFERTHTERPASTRPSSARPTESRRPSSRLSSGASPRAASRTGQGAGEWSNVLDFEAAHRDRAASRLAASRSAARVGDLSLESFSSSAPPPTDSAPARRREKSGPPPCHWGLFVISLVLTILSVPLIYSASTAIALDHHGNQGFFMVRQVMYASIGALILVGASRLSSKALRKAVWACYILTLVGLLATDFTPLGLVNGGVRRWAKLGPVQFQFSELAKIAILGVMADFWSRAGHSSPREWKPWGVTAALVLPIVGLVFLQPHLSAAVLLFLLPFPVAFYAGASPKLIGKIMVPLALLVGVTVVLCASHKMPLLKEYQQERIAAHFGASPDEKGSNYQALQGQGALARGGLLGSGPGGSLYKQGHLPAPHTDFILAVTGEEWGLVGMTLLLGAYGLMIFFCFHTGHCASSPFEALLCAGVGTLLGTQVICNVGVVTGMLPVTGMPLPLLSFGGSGMLCVLLGLGFVLSVSRRFVSAAPKEQAEAAVG